MFLEYIRHTSTKYTLLRGKGGKRRLSCACLGLASCTAKTQCHCSLSSHNATGQTLFLTQLAQPASSKGWISYTGFTDRSLVRFVWRQTNIIIFFLPPSVKQSIKGKREWKKDAARMPQTDSNQPVDVLERLQTSVRSGNFGSLVSTSTLHVTGCSSASSLFSQYRENKWSFNELHHNHILLLQL